MTVLNLSTDLASPPDAVWAVAGDFGGLAAWHPWVPNCTLSPDGKTRTIDMGAMSAVETLESEGALTHSYRVDRSPMPVANYRATWTAAPVDGGTRLTVEARFEPAGVPEAQAVAMLNGFFDTAFTVLAGRFGSP